MKTVQWQMQENFNFPAATGMPTGAETVKVMPRFTIDRTEASVRLTGIYHLAVNVKLEGEVGTQSTDESVIFIDDVDLKGNTAYFEYAVPFNIDLPPEADDPLNIVTTNVVCVTDGQGTIGIIWDVECSYREVVIVQEESPEQKAAYAEAKLAEKEELQSDSVLESKPEQELTTKLEKKSEPKSEAVVKQEPKTDSKSEPVVKQEPKIESKSEPVVKQEPKIESKSEAVAKQEQELESKSEPVVKQVSETVPRSETVVEQESKVEESVSSTAEVKLETVPFSEEDEVLGFITGLDDGYSVTSFRSNDVSV